MLHLCEITIIFDVLFFNHHLGSVVRTFSVLE